MLLSALITRCVCWAGAHLAERGQAVLPPSESKSAASVPAPSLWLPWCCGARLGAGAGAVVEPRPAPCGGGDVTPGPRSEVTGVRF